MPASTNAPPLIIGNTTDETGLYGDSGVSERRGILMAISVFVKRYRLMYLDSPLPTPGNVFYNACMATANPVLIDANDLYKIISRINPESVEEPADQTGCELDSFARTPILEPRLSN